MLFLVVVLERVLSKFLDKSKNGEKFFKSERNFFIMRMNIRGVVGSRYK